MSFRLAFSVLGLAVCVTSAAVGKDGSGEAHCVRQRFSVGEPSQVVAFTVEVASDGPFTINLNEIEVLHSPRPLPYSTDAATGEVQGYLVDLSGMIHELVVGKNVLELRGDELIARPKLHIDVAEVEIPETALELGNEARVLVPEPRASGPRPAYVILMICDGCGPLHLQAANMYAGLVPAYQSDPGWLKLWMSTFPAGSSYNGALAWSDLNYPLSGYTDSAASASAMFSGTKTSNGRINVDQGATARFENIGEHARKLRFAVGAVSTVPVSHATPAAFTSHNLARQNYFAIADEAFFGDPNTTGTLAVDPKYGGGFGSTLPVTDVLVGARGEDYIHPLQRDKLTVESGLPAKHVLVEGEAGVDGAATLLAAAADPLCTMLAGLFDRADLRVTAAGGGYELETPSLAASTAAALTVLERTTAGFVLMVEGGAVDWAGHANDMDWAVGELLDFNAAVDVVVEWVDNPTNGSTWDNTFVVVTADHETGYLTAAPGVFPDLRLEPGSVNNATLALEKIALDTGRRASWSDDNPPNNTIDPGETVYWTWNTGGHSNTLVRVFARGLGSEQLGQMISGVDPVRGAFIDNTAIFEVSKLVLEAAAVIFVDGFESGDVAVWGSPN